MSPDRGNGFEGGAVSDSPVVFDGVLWGTLINFLFLLHLIRRSVSQRVGDLPNHGKFLMERKCLVKTMTTYVYSTYLALP